MFSINGSFPDKQIIDDLKKLDKQFQFANVLALTRTAKDVQAADQKLVGDEFDRPTIYTKNAFRVTPATKAKPVATVDIKNDTFKGTRAEDYLKPQIDGGSRKQKRFERALVAAGLLPMGYYVVPGEACPLDQYGNIPSRFIVQMLSYFKAFGEQGYKANMTDKGRERFNKKSSRAIGQAASYFAVGLNQKLKPGIYQRVAFSTGSAVRPVFVFVKSVGYTRRFKFYEISEQVIGQRFKTNLDDSLKVAKATSR